MRKQITATTTLLMTLLCIVIVAVMSGCQSQEPQEPEPTLTQRQVKTVPENAHSNSIPIISAPGASASASLIQDYTLPPQSIQDLVNRSEAIVVGKVIAISEPVTELPYFKTEEYYADWPEWMIPYIEVAYWDISIEEVLLDDGNIQDHPRIRLEPNAPHRPDEPLPQLNGRYLFTLGRNPDSLSYGISADWMILSLDGDGILDLAGNEPGYVGITGELSLVASVLNAAANHQFLPVGEWPLRSASHDGQDGGDPPTPGDMDGGTGPVGSTGEDDS